MAHKEREELSQEISLALEKVKVGRLYYHYKNPDHLYVLEFVGCLESSEEVCVGYRALYGKGILWVRTVEDFTKEIEIDGQMIPRFKKFISNEYERD